MKRFIILTMLVACSQGTNHNESPCQSHSCAEYQHDMAQACGKMDDGCGKQLDCGPCNIFDLSGSGGMGGSTATSTSATTGSSLSQGGEGGTNMCQDLTFDK